MNRFLIVISIFIISINGFAKVEPVEGIEPSGTLPILYINTENATPVDQKVNYIDAEWWLITNGYEGYENIGSAEKPQKTGIRGRGNTSWTHDGQKPYKLKLDKKTEILGMGKNKHWALLARIKYYQLFNEVLAFEMGRKLGMPFTPEVQPVEVVLNGTYIGLYMLTETIRIDDNRLEIAEQPDENEDIETIEDGWLVEIDNNEDEFQVMVPQPQGYDLLITHHTPEVSSKLQDEWLIDQFSQITQSINSENKLENHWESLVDLEALAKHLIVEESFMNYDGYQGSCYLHKDKGGKWCFGPLWDFSACWVYKSSMLVFHEEQKLIAEFFKFPSFRKELRRVWNDYMENVGNDWVEPFLSEFHEKIKYAVAQSVQVWPNDYMEAQQGYDWTKSTFKHNANFNDNYINENCITYDVTCNFENISLNEKAESDESFEESFEIKFNEISRKDAVVLKGDSLRFALNNNADYNIYYVLVNGEIIEIEDPENIIIEFENISEDKIINIAYGQNPLEDIEVILKGKVTDRRGNPIPNALIKTSYKSIPFSCASNEEGYWEMAVISPEDGFEYNLEISAEGYITNIFPSSLSEENEYILKSEIPEDYYLTLNVSAEYPEYDVSGLEISLFMNSSENPVYNEMLEGDGSITLTNLPEGDYIVYIEGQKRGLKNYISLLNVEMEKDIELDITLDEEPLPISDILIIVNKNDKDNYNLEFSLSKSEYILPYECYIQLNGKEYLLESTSLNIEDLSPDDYNLLIYGKTPSSELTPVKEFEMSLSSENTVVISPVNSLENDYEYYDLNGFKTEVENIGSGIYIRTNGLKSDKIYIKK